MLCSPPALFRLANKKCTAPEFPCQPMFLGIHLSTQNFCFGLNFLTKSLIFRSNYEIHNEDIILMVFTRLWSVEACISQIHFESVELQQGRFPFPQSKQAGDWNPSSSTLLDASHNIGPIHPATMRSDKIIHLRCSVHTRISIGEE